MNDPYSPGYIPDPYQSTGVKFKLNMPKTQKKKIQKTELKQQKKE